MSARATFKNLIIKSLNRLRRWMHFGLDTSIADQGLLLGKMASWQVRQMLVLSTLQDAEFKVSSQWGEDGIIDWLIERAQIPPCAQSFIELGVESYIEANTRFLLQNRGWRGLIIDGSDAMVEKTKREGFHWKYDFAAKPAFITRENVNSLIADAGFSGEIGLLSVDLDGNDYWIWEAIDVVRPILCICEYNAVFGDIHLISVLYAPDFFRTKAHYSNLYFGASIAALCSLAAKKGYRFVGSTTAGNDAFFVREDYAQHFVDSSIKRIEALPSRARESRDPSGDPTYVGKLERLQLISAMPVVNTATGEISKISDLGPVYSDEWLAAMMA